MERFAKFISWLFLPLFTPIYGLLLVFFFPATPKSFLLMDALYYYPLQIKWLYILLFVVFIVLAPGFSLIVLKMNGSISSLSLPDRSERTKPITIMIFYTLVLFGFIFYQGDQLMTPSVLKGMALGGFVSTLIAYLWNRYEKLSLHGIGVGALFGFLYTYFLQLETFSFWILILSVVIGGITLAARLYLNAHNLKQVFYGYLVGFLAQFFSILFFSYKF